MSEAREFTAEEITKPADENDRNAIIALLFVKMKYQESVDIPAHMTFANKCHSRTYSNIRAHTVPMCQSIYDQFFSPFVV
jgi:hypothetical protein